MTHHCVLNARPQFASPKNYWVGGGGEGINTLPVEVTDSLATVVFIVGKIPYYTMPPTRNVGEPLEAAIVTELGKEFNVDEVYGNESSFIGSLKSVDDFQPVDEVYPNNRLNFNETMIKVCRLFQSYYFNLSTALFGGLKGSSF